MKDQKGNRLGQERKDAARVRGLWSMEDQNGNRLGPGRKNAVMVRELWSMEDQMAFSTSEIN
jgi:hypothetical protein